MRLILAGFISAIAFSACSAGSAAAPTIPPDVSSDVDVTLTPVVEAEFPWGLAFLPNGDLLFTEKDGGLNFVAGGEGEATPVTGMPPALTEGQGGYFGFQGLQ